MCENFDKKSCIFSKIFDKVENNLIYVEAA